MQALCFLSPGITLAQPADDDWFESDNIRQFRADSNGNQIARLKFGLCCSFLTLAVYRKRGANLEYITKSASEKKK